MPTIESRKTGEVQYIDMKTYENLKRTGHIRRYVVVDDSDLEPVAVTESKKLIDFPKVESSLKPKEIYSREDLEKKLKDELILLYSEEYNKEIDKKLTKAEIIDLILLEPLREENQ